MAFGFELCCHGRMTPGDKGFKIKLNILLFTGSTDPSFIKRQRQTKRSSKASGGEPKNCRGFSCGERCGFVEGETCA